MFCGEGGVEENKFYDGNVVMGFDLERNFPEIWSGLRSAGLIQTQHGGYGKIPPIIVKTFISSNVFSSIVFLYFVIFVYNYLTGFFHFCHFLVNSGQFFTIFRQFYYFFAIFLCGYFGISFLQSPVPLFTGCINFSSFLPVFFS